MNEFILYCHKNKINGKVYIGITKNIKIRWSSNGKQYKDCPAFSNALTKYGWNNFEHIILMTNLNSNDAIKYEIETIKKYNSTNSKFGYNVSLGGDLFMLGIKQTTATIEKRKNSLKGVVRTDEWKKNISLGNKGKKRTTPVWNKGKKTGKTMPDSHYKKLTELHKKPVKMYNKNGDFICEFNSISDVEKELKIKHISSCCNYKRKSSGGYMWRFKDDKDDVLPFKIINSAWNKGLKGFMSGEINPMKREEIKEKFRSVNNKNARSILQFDKNKILIKEWSCMTDVSRFLKIHVSNITRCCKNEIKTTGGFIFKYKSEYIP